MSNGVKSAAKEAKKEIKIAPTYQEHVFLGWASGLFQLKSAEERPYYNMYVFSPVSDYVSDEYEASNVGQEQRLRSVIGILDGAPVVKVPAVRLPADFGFMLAHSMTTTAPTKLEDYSPAFPGHWWRSISAMTPL